MRRRDLSAITRMKLVCPYCGEGRRYGEATIPRDDCCLPRAAEQLGWITDYLARDGVRERLRAGDSEATELAATARRLRRILAEAEAESSGAITFALAAIEERVGKTRPWSLARRAVAGLGGER